MKSHYYTTPLKKMGKWALLPADLDTWYAEDTTRYFKRVFGFGKGPLIFVTFYDGGLEHLYLPAFLFKKVYNFIRTSTVNDYKSLARRLRTFYSLQKKTKARIPKILPPQAAKLSDKELIAVYKKNRDFVHQATVFDQFGWIGEEYWPPIEKKILRKKGIQIDSPEYHRVLFALIKPEEISTTLEEKRAVIKAAIAVAQKTSTLPASSRRLSSVYGWMPVSAYGDPWYGVHYQKELKELLKLPLPELQKSFQALLQYAKIRNQDIKDITKQYQFTPQELQVFLDHGLALDTRNEAEYLVSYCGYYVLPLYHEMSKRLGVSMRQLRSLYEHEIVQALQGTLHVQEVLSQRRRICGYGYNQTMTKRIYFTPQEAERLFQYIEKRIHYVQGTDEAKGLCASPGVVQGVIKVVHFPEDNKKVKKGDIMVAVATMVEHLPAMKNAGAVVTEVGGLTCHAAVVSREFGIPCIVGLKNATTNFKDGERVEVDATKGIVRKI